MDLGARCPDWVMPNADAAGYYRWSMPAYGLARLMGAGWSHLTERERLSVADDLTAAYAAGTADGPTVFGALARFASDDSRDVAEAPMGLVDFARFELAGTDLERASVARFGERLYR